MYRRGRSRKKEVYIKTRREESRSFLRRLYQSYYKLDPTLLLPNDMQFREFAFQPWGSSSYIRHLSFSNEEELRSYIREKIPLHAYHSIAFYDLPEAPRMEEKGFRGAELLFDIDADHLPGCEGVFEDRCLIEAAKEAEKLIKILKRDLNAEVFPYFTGNRGFHVRAWCPDCLKLGRDERRLIANYVAAVDIKIDLLFPEPKRRFMPAPPSIEDPGWRGWIAEALKEKISPFSKAPEPLTKILGRSWKEKLKEIIDYFSVKIDLQVTQDISRLTRIPGTLNGKASLLVTYVKDPSQFKPSKNLSPFSGEIEVRVKENFEGKLLGERLELRRGEEVSLSADVAVILITKGQAEVIGGEVIVGENPSWRSLQGIHWPPRAVEYGASSRS